MIATYLKEKKYNIPNNIATYLLSGIVLDTSSFSLKVKKITFDIASYLIQEGADNTEVQKLFKKNIKQYIKNQKIIMSAKNINNTLITLGKKGITFFESIEGYKYFSIVPIYEDTLMTIKNSKYEVENLALTLNRPNATSNEFKSKEEIKLEVNNNVIVIYSKD